MLRRDARVARSSNPRTPAFAERRATHPRCECEGCPDRPGRASSKEGESWAIIAKLSWVSIHRSCVMRLRLRMAVGRVRFGFSGRSRTCRRRRRKLVHKLAANYERLTFCYEAGPTGYGLHRQIKDARPRVRGGGAIADPKEAWRSGEDQPAGRAQPGEAVARRRADRGLGSGRRHEAMRDLTRARETAMMDLRTKRQHVSAFLLRLGRPYPAGKKTWTKVHMSGSRARSSSIRERRIVLRGDDVCDPPGARASRAAGASYPRCRAGLVACARWSRH